MDVKRRFSFLTACAVLAVALSGCSGSDDAGARNPSEASSSTGSASPGDPPTGSPSPSDDVLVLQPGAPGEPTTTGGVVPADPAPWNHADLAFVQMMIPHHAQALQMAELASSRAEDQAVRRLAERVEAAQGPEILLMASWLEEQGVDVPRAAEDPLAYDHGEHGHDGMVGMLSPAAMEQLRSARGAAFDRRYLRAMVQHHRGAIQMAETVAVEGSALQVNELAADVGATQLAEIDRMRDVLVTLG